MSKPHIFIATPMHSQQVWFSYHRSLLATFLHLPPRGVTVSDGPSLGNCSIPHARCGLQAQFLADPQYTHLMWIDSDIGWSPRDIIRMLKTGRELVAGVYQNRSDEVEFPVTFATRNPVMEPDGCVESETIQGGFVLIQRAAIERMVEALPECRVKLHDADWDHPLNQNCYNFYPLTVATSFLMQTDDGGFSELFKRAGGKLYIMPDVRLTHSGAKDFNGCLSDYVQFRKREAA